MKSETDVLIIGAGPVGLFAVFELGLLNLNCHVVDNLDRAGGQCAELYPEKPIYDIPSRVKITGQELTDDLLDQCKPFKPTFHLSQQAEIINKKNDKWEVQTSNGTIIVAKCIVIAGGAGSFVPRKPPLENIDKYENKTILYSIKDRSKLKEKKILISGGGDSALDWTNDLASISDVTLIHRRKDFRASPDSVSKMLDLEKKGNVKFIICEPKSIVGDDKIIKKIICNDGEKDIPIDTDYFIPFYGLKMELGPIAKWGLNLDQNLINVDTEKFETSTPTIFSIGDINTYPGKLKLILSGFHEAALMAQQCFRYCRPDKKLVFRYTTSSKDLQKKLNS